jgi:hypothetical protein
MSQPITIQLKDFCRLFAFEDRQVRFVLEQGFVPKGVAHSPCTGNRREFGPAHAFWLAITVLLRSNGLKTSTAAEMASKVSEGLRVVTQNLNWDWTFLPLQGWFETDHNYFLEIGDVKYIRLLTDACPSHDGLYEFPWQPVGSRTQIHGLKPFVTLRLDLTEIARVLAKVDGWACPHRSHELKKRASR